MPPMRGSDVVSGFVSSTSMELDLPTLKYLLTPGLRHGIRARVRASSPPRLSRSATRERRQRPLAPEERALAVDSPAIPRERPILLHHPVAGYGDGHGVGGAGPGHGA